MFHKNGSSRGFAACDGSAVKSHSTILQRLRRQISLDYYTIPPATQARPLLIHITHITSPFLNEKVRGGRVTSSKAQGRQSGRDEKQHDESFKH